MPILCLDVQEISGAAAAILRPKGNKEAVGATALMTVKEKDR